MEQFSRIFSIFSDFFQVKLLVALMGGTIGGFLSKNNAGARGYAQSLSIWFLAYDTFLQRNDYLNVFNNFHGYS